MGILERTHSMYSLRSWLPRLRLLGVYLGLVLACLALGFMFGSGEQILGFLLIALAVGVLGALFLMYYFESAVLLIIFTALVAPMDIPTGTATQIPLSMLFVLVLCGIWVFSMYTRHSFRLVPSGLNAPLLALAACFCFSTVWGAIWRDPIVVAAGRFVFVQGASLLSFLASVGAALLIGNFVHSERWLRVMMGSMMFCGILVMLSLIFDVNQDLLNVRGLGLMWVAAVSYSMLITIPKQSWYWQILELAVIGLWFWWQVIINPLWLSGWLPVVLALAMVTWLRSKRLALVMVCVGLVVLFFARGWLIEIFTGDIAGGSDERPIIWRQNWTIIRAHWLFGTGVAGYAPYNMTYFPAFAWSNHNNYMDLAAQFGFTGMLIWIWLAIAGVFEGWRASRRAPPGFLRALALAATGGWIGALGSMMLGDWVLPFAYNIGVGGFKHTVFTWIFLGIIISINTILDRQSDATRQAS
jgi:hypothetical protein